MESDDHDTPIEQLPGVFTTDAPAKSKAKKKKKKPVDPNNPPPAPRPPPAFLDDPAWRFKTVITAGWGEPSVTLPVPTSGFNIPPMQAAGWDPNEPLRWRQVAEHREYVKRVHLGMPTESTTPLTNWDSPVEGITFINPGQEENSNDPLVPATGEGTTAPDIIIPKTTITEL